VLAGSYFINCEAGRTALALQDQAKASATVTLDQVKPNIFKLYEENIGPLTPIIADALRDAEATYSAEWIKEALEIAVQNNVRRWRYIETILDRWQKEGRNGTDRGRDKTDYRSYIND
jgi:DnaD/phage-associated family protein